MATDKTMDDYSVLDTRIVRHGLFWFYRPEEQVINGEQKVILVQHTAFAGDKVELYLNSDLERAEKHGAVHSQEESQARIERSEVRLPEPDNGEGNADDDGEEVELKDLEDQELVDWLMSTGEFDGNKKPTASEVVSGVGNDAELAARVVVAENTATGGNPRSSVVDPLNKVTEGSSQS